MLSSSNFQPGLFLMSTNQDNQRYSPKVGGFWKALLCMHHAHVHDYCHLPVRLSRRKVSSFEVPFTSFTMLRMSGWRGLPRVGEGEGEGEEEGEGGNFHYEAIYMYM